MELNQLEDLMRMAVKYGLIKLEFQDVKLEFSTTRAALPQEIYNEVIEDNKDLLEALARKDESTESLTPKTAELMPEDLLFWSAEQPTEPNLSESLEKVA